MNLNELVGVKKYKDIPLHTLIDDVMAEKGYDKIGSGAFGAAYRKPGADYVYKLFVRDSCYAKFIRHAMKNPSIHYPKVHGFKSLTSFWKRLESQANEKLYIVKIEYVEPGLGDYDYTSLASMVRYYGSNPIKKDTFQEHMKDEKYANTPEKLKQTYSFFNTCYRTMLLLRGCDNDLHPGNFGIRNARTPEETFVLLDPAVNIKEINRADHPVNRRYSDFD
jgi:hypothetical protein